MKTGKNPNDGSIKKTQRLYFIMVRFLALSITIVILLIWISGISPVYAENNTSYQDIVPVKNNTVFPPEPPLPISPVIDANNTTPENPPKNYSEWMDYGMNLSSVGEHEEALMAFNEAITLDSASASGWKEYGKSLLALGRVEEARVSFSRASDRDNSSTEIEELLGLTELESGLYDPATQRFENVTRKNPDDPISWNYLALSYAGNEKYESALNAVRKSIELDMDYSDGWKTLADILSLQGKYLESIAAYEKSLTLNPGDVDTETSLADVYSKAERYEEAIQIYNESLLVNPDSKEIWIKMGKALEGVGDFDAAADAYVKGGIEILGEDNVSLSLPEMPAPVNETVIVPIPNVTRKSK